MRCSELRWWDSPATAVWPDFAVFLPPLGDDRARLLQGYEPVLVETLVKKLAVEAFDIAVLHRPSWLNMQVLDAVGQTPSHEGSARELRALSVRTARG